MAFCYRRQYKIRILKDILYVFQGCCQFLGLNFITCSVLNASRVDSTSHSVCVYAIINNKVGQLIFEALHMRHYYMNSRFKSNWDLNIFL